MQNGDLSEDFMRAVALAGSFCIVTALGLVGCAKDEYGNRRVEIAIVPIVAKG
jgi:hypothetical protein